MVVFILTGDLSCVVACIMTNGAMGYLVAIKPTVWNYLGLVCHNTTLKEREARRASMRRLGLATDYKTTEKVGILKSAQRLIRFFLCGKTPKSAIRAHL